MTGPESRQRAEEVQEQLRILDMADSCIPDRKTLENVIIAAALRRWPLPEPRAPESPR